VAPSEPNPAPAPAGFLRRRVRWLLPLGAVCVTGAVVALLVATRPQPKKAPPTPPPPTVRAEVVSPQNLQLTVVAHGTVAPRTESDLVAEVSGRVTRVAPALEAGGFFREGDELLRLDGREHEIAVASARAALALAKSEHELAEAEVRRGRKLSKRGAASSADLEQLESRAAVAQAAVDQARASLARAELDLERTVMRAPFDGRVRDRAVDIGQFVSPGTLLARIFAVDFAEVRLPIRTEELSFLDLPLGLEEIPQEGGRPRVVLSAELGGRRLEWPAELVRAEGEIDLRTRMLGVVARVEDPYARQARDHTPLPAGLFVRAEIEGRELTNVFVLPTTALRDGEKVFVVDPEFQVRIRPVEVLRHGREQVVISAGLEAGELVILSPLRFATEGMRVRVLEGDTASKAP